MSGSKQWLSAYLFYSEPWEKFLIEAVHPFVENIFKEGLSEQFFFIRYWERGPHIRLRFKGQPDLLENVLRPKLKSYFRDYFNRYPTVRKDPDWVKNLPEGQKWFPNNSIQLIAYEPEIIRYGGSVGLLIAEKQFEISSRCVLAVIRESSAWDYERALGAAIQMHLSFAHSMGMTLQETVRFYSYISEGWLLNAVGHENSQSFKELDKKKEIVLNAFIESFDKQKAKLASFHKTLWNALDNRCEFEQEWLNTWHKGISQIAAELRRAQLNQQLILEKSKLSNPSNIDPKDIIAFSQILESYVHMTNNRLGIMNHDEAYLGFLITQSLLSLGTNNPDLTKS